MVAAGTSRLTIELQPSQTAGSGSCVRDAIVARDESHGERQR